MDRLDKLRARFDRAAFFVNTLRKSKVLAPIRPSSFSSHWAWLPRPGGTPRERGSGDGQFPLADRRAAEQR